VIHCEEVTRVYPMGEANVTALRGVSFDIARGEFAAITGRPDVGRARSCTCSASWMCRRRAG
jgi:ABC-type lipoprotein export system ATPase subunit